MRLPAPVRNAIESVRSRITAPERRELAITRDNAELMAESLSDLERQLHDPGWTQFVAYAQQEFSAEGMVQLRAICRLYSLKNPLLKRGAALRSAYVHGQGVEITARANGKDHTGEQDVQKIVSAFLDDPGNQRTLTSARARDQLEHALFTDGEFFHALFTSPRTGRVQVRTLPADEIVEVICNPEDNSEPWFYRRRWVQMTYQANGTQHNDVREELYPCIDYRPAGVGRFRTYANMPIRWDAPVLHTAVNQPLHWHRGIPDAYAAIDWARAYKTFLEDWATLMRSLAKFAWRLTAKGSARSQARRAMAAGAQRDPLTGKALDAGGTAVTPADQILEAIPKTGATMDADSGRPIAAMVAAALSLSVVALLGDPGTTGARATAETLDKPTELVMGQRRELWTSVLRRILTYVVTEAVRASSGPLKGSIARDPYTEQEVVTLDGDSSTQVDIDWPDLTDADVETLVKAIVEANGTGTMPPELTLRLALTALKVRGADELIEQMLDEDGEFEWPKPPPMGPGSQAAGLLRDGQDPTGAGPGRMEDPDDPDPPDEDDTEEEEPSDEEDEEQDG